MAEILMLALPVLVIAGFAALIIAAIRSDARHDPTMREIQASLDEVERRLEKLDWLHRSEPQDEEDS